MCVATTSVAAASDSCPSGDFSTWRDPSNPLALPVLAHGLFSTNPLSGARFFVDHKKGLAIPYLRRHSSLRKIADQPENKRFTRFTGTAAVPTC